MKLFSKLFMLHNLFGRERCFLFTEANIGSVTNFEITRTVFFLHSAQNWMDRGNFYKIAAL